MIEVRENGERFAQEIRGIQTSWKMTKRKPLNSSSNSSSLRVDVNKRQEEDRPSLILSTRENPSQTSRLKEAHKARKS